MSNFYVWQIFVNPACNFWHLRQTIILQHWPNSPSQGLHAHTHTPVHKEQQSKETIQKMCFLDWVVEWGTCIWWCILVYKGGWGYVVEVRVCLTARKDYTIITHTPSTISDELWGLPEYFLRIQSTEDPNCWALGLFKIHISIFQSLHSFRHFL